VVLKSTGKKMQTYNGMLEKLLQVLHN